MKKLFMILFLAVAAAAYFSHLNTVVSGVCYASGCPDGCGGSDPDGTGGGGDSSPDGTDDGGGSGSDPDGSGGGDF